MRPLYLLCLDFRTCLGNRYRRGPGNRAERVIGPKIGLGAPEEKAPIGSEDALKLLETFRLKGSF